jgi:hypothetical protein
VATPASCRSPAGAYSRASRYFSALDLADIALCEAIKAENEVGLPHEEFMAALQHHAGAGPTLAHHSECPS